VWRKILSTNVLGYSYAYLLALNTAMKSGDNFRLCERFSSFAGLEVTRWKVLWWLLVRSRLRPKGRRRDCPTKWSIRGEFEFSRQIPYDVSLAHSTHTSWLSNTEFTKIYHVHCLLDPSAPTKQPKKLRPRFMAGFINEKLCFTPSRNLPLCRTQVSL
jgi:hypothetical protein